MDWLAGLFRRRPKSAQVAKDRLKLVLSYDRTNLSPEILSQLQEDIVRVISQRVEIDPSKISISTQRAEGGDHLIADIPIRGMRRGAPLREVVSPVPGPTSKKKKSRRK